MVEVIPGILEQNFTEIVRKVRMVEEFIPWVQIDLLDGTLFGNTNFHNPEKFSEFRTAVKLELHMMVKNPQQLVDAWAGAGIRRFIAHLEGLSDPEIFIAKVRSKNLQVGLALDIDTPVEKVKPFLPNIDVVLIMTIHTGKSGQAFQLSSLNKISKLREFSPDFPIEVDGGINLETGKKVVEAGATRLVSTSYIFSAANISAAIKKRQQV
jgi:ribulose-phosphate 3-epimerase